MSGPRDFDRRRELGKRIGTRERRRLWAARHRDESIWFGLGTFGVVGWSVSVPTVAGLLIGIWIDGRWPSRFSWTLMLLLAGLALGCLSAWRWVEWERRLLEEERESKRDEHD